MNENNPKKVAQAFDPVPSGAGLAQPGKAVPQDATGLYHQRLSVPFEYPVHFARDVFAADNPLLASVLDRLGEGRRHRAAVYVDRGVAETHAGLLERIGEYFHARGEKLELAAPPAVLPGGETVKNDWSIVREVMWTLGNLHLDRQSFVLAVGGGSLLDMLGFAASIVHRGLRLVRMPTTTLAQGDGGVGVKNGMDEHGMKNFVGTFAPPFAVINDFAFLPTLKFEDWIAGAAEAFKVAIIRDVAFFHFLCGAAPALRARDQAAMEQLVRRCAILHLEHIASGGDPFEFGSARPLDFGHWAAHKIETLSGYTIGHGQAAAVGIAIDSYYAMRQGLLANDDFARILKGLRECGLPIFCPPLELRDGEGRLSILGGLGEFREHLGGRLTVTLPDGIGHKVEVHHMDEALVEEAVEHLRAFAAGDSR